MPLPPIELDHFHNPRPRRKSPRPSGATNNGSTPLFQGAQRRRLQMIVMIVTDEHEAAGGSRSIGTAGGRTRAGRGVRRASVRVNTGSVIRTVSPSAREGGVPDEGRRGMAGEPRSGGRLVGDGST